MSRADVTHWTNKGAFRIEAVVLGGSVFCKLWFNDQHLATYTYAFMAAESISKGEHDQMLGFKASGLNVPVSVKDWNNLA